MIGDTLVCLLYIVNLLVSLNTHTHIYNSILKQMEEGIQTLVPGDERELYQARRILVYIINSFLGLILINLIFTIDQLFFYLFIFKKEK